MSQQIKLFKSTFWGEQMDTTAGLAVTPSSKRIHRSPQFIW